MTTTITQDQLESFKKALALMSKAIELLSQRVGDDFFSKLDDNSKLYDDRFKLTKDLLDGINKFMTELVDDFNKNLKEIETRLEVLEQGKGKK